MRLTREFVGSFGAGVSLAVASSLCLMIVSGLIAFRGWPDDLQGSGRPSFAQLSAGPARTPRKVLLPAASSPVAVALRTPARRAAAQRSPSVGPHAVVGPSNALPPRSDEPVGSGGVAPTVASTVSPASSPTVGSRVAAVAGLVGATLTQTTKTLSEAVGALVPAATAPLASVTAATGTGVDQPGRVVGSLIP